MNWADAITAPLKTASSMVEKLIEVRDSVKFGDAINKLNAQILSAHHGALAAHQSQLALLEEMGSLKKQLADFETFDSEKARYELKDVGQGRGSVLVYVLKEDAQRAEPPHQICPNCYQHRAISILQATQTLRNRIRVHFCPECKTDFAYGHVQSPPIAGTVLSEYDPFKNM